MTRVGVVARGAAFWPSVATWIAENCEGRAKVLVPGARDAVWVEKLLRERGVEATVVPLRADALAKVCGVEVQAVVSAWKLRAEVGAIVRVLMPEASAARVVSVAGELAEMLERLAVYEVDAEGLRKALPEGMAAHWEANAELLVKVMARVGNFLGRVEAVLPGTAAARVFGEVARREKGWFVAGVVDAVPAARRMVRAMCVEGAVVVPEGGSETQRLVHGDKYFPGWLKELGLAEVEAEKIAGRVEEARVREVVCAGAWAEVEAVSLCVKRAVAEGKKRIAVVTPDGGFAARLNGMLARWELRARVVGGERLSETPAGRVWSAVCGVVGSGDAVAWAAVESVAEVEFSRREIWGALPRMAVVSDWAAAVGKVVGMVVPGWCAMEGAAEIQEALGAAVGEMHGMVDGATASAVMRRMLSEARRPMRGSEGVYFMAPQDARLENFDTVILAGAVEGVWPSFTSSGWLAPAQVRRLGMPDAERRSVLLGSEAESQIWGGGEVIFTHTAAEGSGRVVSRFFKDVVRERDLEVEGMVRHGEARRLESLGVFVPEGGNYPHLWSASFVETMTVCPFRAYAERILKLRVPDPIEPVPDARVGGLLVHAWLEQVGREFPRVTEENEREVTARLLAVAEEVLADKDAVVRALWKPRMVRLAPALAARWLADGRAMEAVEKEVRREVGAVTVRAIVDRVEVGSAGRTVLDFKTGGVPAWKDVACGLKPQLALEAWLLGEVEKLEYWRLLGYGQEPLEVREAAAEPLVAPVAEGVGELVDAFGEGAPFPALPDRKGGGLRATGHCEYCELAGVCRRQAEAGG